MFCLVLGTPEGRILKLFQVWLQEVFRDLKMQTMNWNEFIFQFGREQPVYWK